MTTDTTKWPELEYIDGKADKNSVEYSRIRPKIVVINGERIPVVPVATTPANDCEGCMASAPGLSCLAMPSCMGVSWHRASEETINEYITQRLTGHFSN